MLKGRLDASSKYMEKLYPDMIARYKKYKSISDPLRDDQGNVIEGRANLFVPYPWAIVESELPRLAGKLPRLRIFPPQGRQVEEGSIRRRQNNLYYAFDRMDFLKIQALWMRQFSIYGFSPLYYHWRTETTNVLTKELGPGGWQLVKKPTKLWDDFWCKVIDVFDSFLQPNISDVDECDWFMFREWWSARDLKQAVQNGLLYPEVLEYLKDGKSKLQQEDSGRVTRDSLIGQTKEISNHAYGKYELMYCLENDKISLMVDRAVLAMEGDNPHPLQQKPIVNLNLLPVQSEPIGMGTIECLGGLVDKLNGLTNARMDNISLQNGKVLLANRNSQTDFDNLVMESGNVILTDDVNNAVKPFEFPDTGISSEREILTTKEELQFTSGVSDYIVGVNGSSRLADTATGVSTIVREANARYALKQATYETGALRKLVKMADKYMQLFMTDKKQVYVNGPEGYESDTVTPEDLAWDADIMIEPGSTAPLDQITRRESLQTLLDRLIRVPQVVNIPKFIKQLLEAYDFNNADELVKLDEPQEGLSEQVELAKGENLAISYGQPVRVEGDDRVHLQVHQEALQAKSTEWTPESREALVEHMRGHMMKLQSQLGGQNAPGNPAPQGGGPAPGGPQGPPMGPPQSMAGGPPATPSGPPPGAPVQQP